MCQNIHLHHSSKGFITYCKACKHIQMAFGNVAICFAMEEYLNFCDYILQFYPQYNKTSFARELWIPTTSKSVCLLLSGKELYDLQEILKKAQNSLELIKLLENIKKQQN